jgi:hypothetical protein
MEESQSPDRSPCANGVPSLDQRERQGTRWAMQGEEKPAAASRPPQAVGEDASRIAERTAATWHRFDAALSPIIGHGGVAALYRRSLFLARASNSWLPGVHEGALDPVEFTELQATVAQQSAADAAAATDALFETFRGLLTELIGSSLTERLLRPVPDPTSHGDAVQDNSP